MRPDGAERADPVILAVDFAGLSTQQSLGTLLDGFHGAAVIFVDPLDADRTGSEPTSLLDAVLARVRGRSVRVVVGNCMSAITALELGAALPAVRLVLLVEPQRATRADIVEEYRAAVSRLGVAAFSSEPAHPALDQRHTGSLNHLAEELATDLWQRCELFAAAQGFSPHDARAFADELGRRQRSWLAYLAAAASRDLPVVGATPVRLLGDPSLHHREALFASVSSDVCTVSVETDHLHCSTLAKLALYAELQSAGV